MGGMGGMGGMDGMMEAAAPAHDEAPLTRGFSFLAPWNLSNRRAMIRRGQRFL